MNKNFGWIVGVILIVIMAVFSPRLQAQEILPLLGNHFGVGARALGMGGAHVGVAEDFSASYWNPAGLGQIHRMEIYGSISQLTTTHKARFLQNSHTTADESNYTNLETGGFVFPVPTYRGSLVFAFGYLRPRSFDHTFSISGFNYSPGDSVYQAGEELETGGIGRWTLAGSVQMSENLYLGGSLNYWKGKDDYMWELSEYDDLDLWTFNAHFLTNRINTKISGFNLTVAGLYCSKQLRVGATLSSPITFTGKEDYQEDETIIYDYEVYNKDSTEVSSAKGYYEYKIQRPYSFSIGASLSLPLLLIAGDVELNDWSQIKYKSPNYMVLNNKTLRRTYQSTLRYRLGGEMLLPFTSIKLRAGYFVDPSPLKNAPAAADKKFLTAGVGILLEQQFNLDIAYIYGWWRDDTSSYTDKIEVKKIFISAAYRF